MVKLAELQLPFDGRIDDPSGQSGRPTGGQAAPPATHDVQPPGLRAEEPSDDGDDHAPAGTMPARRPGSRRTRRLVSAPAIVAYSATDAIDELRARGLNPAVEHEQTSNEDEHGVVLAQEPTAGEALARGATVALWIGAPPSAGDTPADLGAPPEAAPAIEPDVGSDEHDDPWFAAPLTPDPYFATGQTYVESAPPPAPIDASRAGADDAQTRQAGPLAAQSRWTRARQARAATGAMAAGALALILVLASQHHDAPPRVPVAHEQPVRSHKHARAPVASPRRTNMPAPAKPERVRATHRGAHARRPPPPPARPSRRSGGAAHPQAPSTSASPTTGTPSPSPTVAAAPSRPTPSAPAPPAATSPPAAPAKGRSAGERAAEREFGTP